MKTNAYPMLLTAVALGMLSSCQDEYDLDEKLPPNFGVSLMDYLRNPDNHYDNYRRLVEDLGYQEALSGSTLKTLFAANDEAFDRFYQSNIWGVHRYEELTMAQKKMLLYSSMLDNSLQLMNLSSTTGTNGVVEGNAMRRTTAMSIYDTVPVITPDQMPDNNPAWKYYRDHNKSIVCMKDMSNAPMMFLVEKFLKNKRITDEDVNFLFNHTINRKTGDAFVNGVQVVDANLRSANGFLHRPQEVIVPLENMAQIISRKENTKTFSRFLDRFSAPFYAGREVTHNYNTEYGTSVDSVFMLKYYSERSTGGEGQITMPNNRVAPATLKFDPGWNAYMSDDPNEKDDMVKLQKNMAVMLVPSDKALDDYWENGSGQIMKDYYGSWDNVPDKVIVKLINNNMLNSLVESVPSKFKDIINSSNDPMNIEPSDVDSVWIGSNGAIYLTKRVFSPTDYISVLCPALINETMSIFNWAIEMGQYASYLNSLDAYYSFFIPTNNAMLCYIDPVSYGETKTQLWKFHFRENVGELAEKGWASVWEYDTETGVVGDSIGEMRGWNALRNRLIDILDNHIVVGNIESGKEYYRTKNGGVIRVNMRDGEVKGVQNTYQMNCGVEIPVVKVYNQTKEKSGGNGKSYILDMEPMLTTRNSVCDILSERDDCTIFYNLLHGSELFEQVRRGSHTGSKTGNIASFNNYHYTVYVPTDASMEEAIKNGQVMTWEMLEEKELSGEIPPEGIVAEKEKINNFLRYHIQDNSLYLGMDYKNEGGASEFIRNYETAVMNTQTMKFYTVKAEMKENALQVTDLKGNTRHVITSSADMYNLPAREYQLNGGISTSAFAVIHMIDGPLFHN